MAIYEFINLCKSLSLNVKKRVILAVCEKSDREGKCVTGDLAAAIFFVKLKLIKRLNSIYHRGTIIQKRWVKMLVL